MAFRTLETDSRWLLPLLALLVAVGPLTIDMYLPALPGMKTAFDTTISATQLTISSYLSGFALFHLVCGPLADRYGRKPVLIGGMVIFSVAGIGCAASETIEQLITLRFFQGMGACVGPTLGRAIARDVYGPTRAATALAYIAMMMALAPAIAPSLGGVLLEFFPWSSIFYTLAGYGLISIALVALFLPESLPAPQALHPKSIAHNYSTLLHHRIYITTTVASSLMYAGMMSFLSGSSYILIDMLGISPRYFGALFLFTVGGYIGGSALSTRLGRRLASEQVMLIGTKLGVVAGVAMIAASEFYPHWASIVLPMSLYSTALGLVLPHAMGSALKPFPHIAGTASALMGFIQMALGASSGALVGTLLLDSARPMTVVITLSAVAAALLTMRIQPSQQ